MHKSRAILALGVFVAAPLAALAQPPGFTPLQRPDRPPTVSPYLGILGGNSLGINYYEIYRPQREFRSEFNQINKKVNRLRSDVRSYQQTAAPEYEQFELAPTGHPTMFMNTLGYFPGAGP